MLKTMAWTVAVVADLLDQAPRQSRTRGVSATQPGNVPVFIRRSTSTASSARRSTRCGVDRRPSAVKCIACRRSPTSTRD